MGKRWSTTKKNQSAYTKNENLSLKIWTGDGDALVERPTSPSPLGEFRGCVYFNGDGVSIIEVSQPH